MSALDAAIAASCPPWCTRTRHPRWPGEVGEAVVSVAHQVVLLADGDRYIDVHRWIEFTADGEIVESDTTLAVAGFDHAIVRGEDVATLSAALVRAAELLAGVPA